MTKLIAPFAALSLLALGACVTDTHTGVGSQDFARHEAACKERGGVLSRTDAPATDRVETDYACHVSGSGSSRLPG